MVNRRLRAQDDGAAATMARVKNLTLGSRRASQPRVEDGHRLAGAGSSGMRPSLRAKVDTAILDSGRDAGEVLSATVGGLSTFAPHFCIE
jgi:hypothetical protein